MINYTTPTITLTVDGVDISSNYDVYATLEQGAKKITKNGADLTLTAETVGEFTHTTIEFELTQEESALFDYGRSCYAQVNWLDEHLKRAATDIKAIPVMRNLLDEVIGII